MITYYWPRTRKARIRKVESWEFEDLPAWCAGKPGHVYFSRDGWHFDTFEAALTHVIGMCPSCSRPRGHIGEHEQNFFAIGHTAYSRIKRDRGYGGPYGQDRRYAKWACVHCGREVRGTDNKPSVSINDACVRNGHAPCARCGKKLPRLNDGCPREHPWRICPGKTEADRMMPQHLDRIHRERTTP